MVEPSKMLMLWKI